MITQKYSDKQLLAMYANQDVSKSYVRAAKAFLRFALENKFTICESTAEIFSKDKAPTYFFMAKKFIKYYIDLGCPEVHIHTDLSKYNAANSVILAFEQMADISKDSLGVYIRHLNKYSRFTTENDLQFINYKTVLTFREHLEESGLSANTINSAITSIRSLSEFCLLNRDKIEGFTEDWANQLRDIKLVKLKKVKRNKNKNALSFEEREKLLSSIQDPRDRLVISLMVNEGLRRFEISLLKPSFFDFENNMLKVLGKNHKHDLVEVNLFGYSRELALKVLSVMNFSKYSPTKVSKLAKEYMNLAGVLNSGRTAHTLRHTALTLLDKKGWPLEMIQLQARHEEISTTQIYTNQSILERFRNYTPA